VRGFILCVFSRVQGVHRRVTGFCAAARGRLRAKHAPGNGFRVGSAVPGADLAVCGIDVLVNI